jgi:XTP/dITP diphosphohydrolase
MLEGLGVSLLSLNEYPEIPEIVEDGDSFLENAMKKARTAAERTGEWTLADDSGLEVEALGGLEDLKGVPPGKRGAAFRCVLVLCAADGRYEAFEGRWEGRIAEAPAGEGGFGYDPVFFLPDRGMTVAQLPREIKNRISHRARAFEKLREKLREMTTPAAS